MIKSIHISNFQSHENTTLDFHDGVNVIVGRSDSGKTAVLRALRWLITNRPAGEEFRSDWGGDTIVKIDTDDEIAVTRMKTNSRNSYFLDDDPLDSNKELKAMGQSVPDVISSSLNIHPVNMQSQMDSPFLLSDDWSPGRVAEYLNEVSGLAVIDKATAAINAKVRQANAQLVDEESRLADLRKQADNFDYVDELDTRVKAIEDMQVVVSRVRSEEEKINRLCVEIVELHEKISRYDVYEDAGKKIAALIAQDAEAEKLADEEERIGKIADTVKAIRKQITELKDVSGASKAISDVESLIKEHDALNIERMKLESAIYAINNIEEIIEAKAIALDRMEKEWKRVAPEICPFCVGKGKLK